MVRVQVAEPSADPNKPDGDDVVLTPPSSLSTRSSSSGGNSSGTIKRLLSLFRNVSFGSDLTHLQMPPQFNVPKSQLQNQGESICCTNKDLFADCVKTGSSPLQRMTSVVAWSVSTLRPLPFGVAPYNPVLGETHHLSRGDHLHVLLEQVSHHPPISALHGTDNRNNVELQWCHYHTTKFYGTSIESRIHGKRILHLKERGETYVMNTPTLFIRFLPFPAVDWIGEVKIHCQETGLRADLRYTTSSFFGFRRASRNSSIKGKIVDSSTANTLCEIDGHWDRIVKATDRDAAAAMGTTEIIYDANETIGMLQAPTLLGDAKEVLRSESTKLWAEVSKAIMRGEWERARKAKNSIEDPERKLAKQRKQMGQTWVPNHFTLTCTMDDGWTCTPKSKQVLQSPIVFEIPNH